MMGLLEISTESYAQGPISHQMASMTLMGEIAYYFYSLTPSCSEHCQNQLLQYVSPSAILFFLFFNL